jgi:FkbM family methyltransferase
LPGILIDLIQREKVQLVVLGAAWAVYGDEGMVIAFEPQPKLANLVSQSLQATAKSRFKVHQAGCSDRAGEAKLFIPWAGSGSAGVFESFSAKSRHCELKVELTTIDEALSQEDVRESLVIKLDVEGSEFAALVGARNTIQKFKPPILFELNPDSSRAAGRTTRDLLCLLAELGYDSFCEMDEFPERRRADELSLTVQRNLLALHRS